MYASIDPKNHDKFRYLASYTIILTVALLLILIFIYNLSAVLMLFGKGSLSLNSYKDTLQVIANGKNTFKNISYLGDLNNGSIQYDTQDSVGKYMVVGKDGKIISINAQLNIQEFAKLNIVQKYRSIDSMLRPLYVSSDLLAAEISVLRTSSKLAISSLSNKNPQTVAATTKGMKAQYSVDNSSLIISMYAV